MSYQHTILNYSLPIIDLKRYMNDFLARRKNYLDSFPKTLKKSFTDNFLPVIPIESVKKQPKYYSRIVTLLLLYVFFREHAERKELTKKTLKIMNQLQRRFEVDHYLKDTYRASFEQEDAPACQPQIYALFSIALNKLYGRTGNFNYLNTALKLNDFITQSGSLAADQDHLLYYVAARLEFDALKKLHEL